MAIGVGQRCVVRIKITGVELRNAKDIVATVESPQYVAHCQEVSFDEVSGLVYVAVDVNSAGSYSMWLEVRFAEEIVYTPAFVFAEIEGEATPCDAPYIVDVEVAGESVSVTPPKIDVDAVTREEFERLSKDIAEKVDKVEGKGLSTNDFTDEYKKKVEEFNGGGDFNKEGYYPDMSVGMADKVKGVNKVQEALTLTTKPNGNIVIGNLAGQSKEFMPATPSGDPMHYMYEAAGAVWNGSGEDTTFVGLFGETITHKANCWRLNDIGDISNEELRAIYQEGLFASGVNVIKGYFAGSLLRTNICNTQWTSAGSCDSTFGNTAFCVCTLTKNNRSPIPSILNYGFTSCRNLHSIIPTINCNYCTGFTNTFQNCSVLRNVLLTNLKASVSFADSPLLSKESLLYMINNCASNATFTITLHPDVYAKCTDADNGEWYDDVVNAVDTVKTNKGTTITLASA